MIRDAVSSAIAEKEFNGAEFLTAEHFICACNSLMTETSTNLQSRFDEMLDSKWPKIAMQQVS